MPAVIVLGDKTDHGGEVIEASGVTATHGKRIARVGDKVACPKKGHGTTEIVTGDLTMIIDGKAVAYHGCKTSCGATLISGQMVTTVDFSSGFSAAEASTATRATASSSSREAADETAKAPFDLRFLLKGDKTGKPVAGMPYRITLDSGEEFVGNTDADGLTQTVGSDRDACEHFGGEIPDPPNPERMKEVLEQMKIFCTGTDARLAALKAKYAKNQKVVSKLNQYEEGIEKTTR